MPALHDQEAGDHEDHEGEVSVGPPIAVRSSIAHSTQCGPMGFETSDGLLSDSKDPRVECGRVALDDLSGQHDEGQQQHARHQAKRQPGQLLTFELARRNNMR